MRPIGDMWIIQIEVTNACNIHCANCTRFVGHHKEPFFMELSMVEKAIDSLEGYKGCIGLMGGEPAMHPDFLEICRIIQKRIPKNKRGLWTSGYKWEQYKSVIQETFGCNVVYNDHSTGMQIHQPVLVAINDCVEDKNFMRELINKCWVQEKWSASITPRGGFFCEVAAAMNLLFEDGEGYPLDKGWWRKEPKQFKDQVEKYCVYCGGALPLPSIPSRRSKDIVSPANYYRLEAIGSPRFLKGDVEIFDKKMAKEEIEKIMRNWKPWEYLGDDGQRTREELYGSIGSRDVKGFRLRCFENILWKYKEFKKRILRWPISRKKNL